MSTKTFTRYYVFNLITGERLGVVVAKGEALALSIARQKYGLPVTSMWVSISGQVLK